MPHENAWDQQLLQTIWSAPLQSPEDLLLLRDMCLVADEDGRAPLVTLATRFRNFFGKRLQEGKANPLLGGDVASKQSVAWWQNKILDEILPRQHPLLFPHDAEYLVWNSELWTQWSPGFKKALRDLTEVRLIEFFEKNVPGGY